MKLIDGRKIRNEILVDLKIRIKELPFTPVFCDVLVGNNPASVQYVKMKEMVAEDLGIKTHPAVFPENISTDDLVFEIQKISKIPNMSGLIIQLPLPPHIDTKRVLDSVPSEIDVDATSTEVSLKFYENNPVFIFPTASAVMEVFDSITFDFDGKRVVMVGHGVLVGRPVVHILKSQNILVEVVDNTTKNIESVLKTADVVISATGQAGLIKGGMLKEGVVLVDAGTSELDGGISGDIDRDSVENIASVLSPVPGGVGPVTVAMLMQNVVISAERKNIS